jgi:hypothetical protein
MPGDTQHAQCLQPCWGFLTKLKARLTVPHPGPSGANKEKGRKEMRPGYASCGMGNARQPQGLEMLQMFE